MENIQSRSAFPFFLSNVFVARDLADHDSYMVRPSVYKRVINYLPARLFNFLVLLVLEKKGFFVRTKLVKTSKNAVNCLSMGLLGDFGSLNCRIYFPHCYYQSAISSNQGQINISTHSLSSLITILKNTSEI